MFPARTYKKWEQRDKKRSPLRGADVSPSTSVTSFMCFLLLPDWQASVPSKTTGLSKQANHILPKGAKGIPPSCYNTCLLQPLTIRSS